jgi:hypothetical protein
VAPAARRAAAAVVLVVAAAVLFGLYRIASGSEHHSYSSGTLPPSTVRLNAGTTYHLSVRGGVDEVTRRGGSLAAPPCTWSTGGGAPQGLAVAVESAQTKATNTVASFVAPASGDVRIECPGWGAVFVDDAANSAPDVAGWFLVLGGIALAVGVPLGLSALRARSLERARLRRAVSVARATGEYDEVERTVDLQFARGGDLEVRGPDGGDVLD